MTEEKTTEPIETQYVRYCFYEFWMEGGRFKAKYGIEDCEKEV